MSLHKHGNFVLRVAVKNQQSCTVSTLSFVFQAHEFNQLSHCSYSSLPLIKKATLPELPPCFGYHVLWDFGELRYLFHSQWFFDNDFDSMDTFLIGSIDFEPP